MTSAKPLGAEGGGASSRVYNGSDNEDENEEDTSILAELAAMFPNVDHDELVTVLRSHGGDIDATVDYLMALSLQRESGDAAFPSSGILDPEEQFSSEIGGLPEVLPSFMTGMQTDSDSDELEEDVPVNQARKNVGSDEDPLPTYEQAMNDGEGYVAAGSIMLPVATNQRSISEGQPPGSQDGHHLTHKKKRKKKLRKLAGKLHIKKNRSTDYKSSEQERSTGEQDCHLHPLLQPLVKGDELEIERVAT